MEQLVGKATILSLEHFPPYSSPERPFDRIEAVSRFLKKLIAQQKPLRDEILYFPPISQLSFFFKCPSLDVYDAFRGLQKYNFDFKISGLVEPVEVWHYKR